MYHCFHFNPEENGYALNLWYGLGDRTHYLYTIVIKVMFILTHCDVYYITRLLSQYSDVGTFYYKNPHKVIIIYECGFYRFYIIHYLEGFSIINFSTFNSIESYKPIYDLYSFLFIIHKGLGVTFHHVPPFFFILTTFVFLTALIFVYIMWSAFIFTCIV